MMKKLGIILLLMNSYLLFSGDLDDFEKDINKKSPPPQQGNNNYSNDEDDGADGCAESLVEGCFHIMGIIILAGADYSMMRAGMKDPDEGYSVKLREQGEPLLPMVQISTLGQYLGTDKVEIRDQVELGIGPVAFRYRGQNIFEGYDDSLFTHQFLGIMRISLGNNMELGLGGGVQLFYGNSQTADLVLTLPIKMRLTDHLFLDITPSTISHNNGLTALYEGDALLSYHWGPLAIRGGWGWFGNQSSMLTGPALGIAYTL